MKRRILLIHMGNHFGGVEVYLERLSALLKQHATVFALCSHAELIPRLRASGVTTWAFPRVVGRNRVLRTLIAPFLMTLMILRCKIEVAQVNGLAEVFLLTFARLLGCRVISTLHQTLDLEAPSLFKKCSRAIYLKLVSVADHVVCVSETVAAGILAILPANRVSVIPNWAPIARAYNPKAPRKTEPLKLLFVGRLEQHKGVHVLLAALKGLESVRLVVVGDGSASGKLKELARGLDVQFEGFRSNLDRYYDEADLFVLPSFGPEGFPLVSLEAMSRGVPCLLSDLPVHREITNGGRAAALFRTGDVDDLQTKLTELRDGTKRNEIAQNGYRLVTTKYSAETAKAAYLGLFDLDVTETVGLPARNHSGLVPSSETP